MTATAEVTDTPTDIAPAESVNEVDGVFIRPEPGSTLEDVLHEWSQTTSQANVNIDSVEVRLEDEEPTISFGGHETPATDEGLEMLGRHLKMPVKYLLEVPRDEQQFMLTHRLNRASDERLVIDYTSAGIEGIRTSGKMFVSPEMVADRVAKHMPVESPVRDYWLTPNELRLDVCAPMAGHLFTGGDRAVNDITKGGVRIHQDRRANRTPEVHTFLYRLVCTNGMEMPTSARVEGRKSFEDDQELGNEIESLIVLALQEVEHSIQAHYALRNERVESPKSTMRQMALDRGMSALMAQRLADRVSTIEEPTMFDLVNLMTNVANLSPRSPRGRSLQQAAGHQVGRHDARCATCHKVI